MHLEQASDKLQLIGQQSLLSHFNELAAEARAQLLKQVAELDLQLLSLQKDLLKNQTKPVLAADPLEAFSQCGNAEDVARGQKLIEAGACGCLLIAGGQGTRLGVDGPKGVVPVSVIKDKSLFQLFAERVGAASKKARRPLPLAIMTSPLNDKATRAHFEENDYFGLQRDQVSFFCQNMLPLLNESGDLFMEAESRIAFGPDGNGSALSSFVASGISHQEIWKRVNYVNFVLIDNALADPYDAELFGFQDRLEADVVVKAIEREDPSESVGVLMQNHGKVCVVEYSELSDSEKKSTSADGSLKHLLANISLFSFSMDFIRCIAQLAPDQIPLHLAQKAVSSMGQKVMAWKFERFIFDLLNYSRRTSVLVYPRNVCFAPLKNKSGKDSLQTVQQALKIRDRHVFEQITGSPVSSDVTFELAADFYYPTVELLARWKDQSLPAKSYITP